MTPRTRASTSVAVPVQQRRALCPRTRIDEEIGSESDLTPLEDQVPKKQRAQRKTAARKRVAVEDEQMSREEGQVTRSKSRKRTQVLENAANDSEVPLKKRKRACKPELVYIIPDVKKKATTFRGRLGKNDVCYLSATRMTLIRRLCVFKYCLTEYEARE